MKKPIDLSAVTVDSSNAIQLGTMLRGRNISEFFYVAAHFAGIEAEIVEKEGESLETLQLEDIFSQDADTVFSAEDVDELVREITLSPANLDLSHGSSRPDPNLSGESHQSSSRKKRKAVAYQSYRWSTDIPYVISADFANDAGTQNVIKLGIKNWEEETCLRFNQVSDFQGAHIIFRKMQGCWSKVGMQYGENGQFVSIGPGCEAPGIVVHEIGHALGFHHEHQRPDRDSYITINFQNIEPGKSSNFLARPWKYDLTGGVPYDFASVMHYVFSSFTANGQNTMTSLEEDMGTVAGSQYALSFYDAKLANLMYCAKRCTGGLTWSACQHDGYRDPDDCSRCKCPDGWTGRYCTQLQPGVNGICGSELVPSFEWKTLTSPNYQSRVYLNDRFECTWRIKTFITKARIVVRFKNSFRLPCNRYVEPCNNYIEIRNKEMAKTGPRYCCNYKPTEEISSHGREMLILLRLNGKQYSENFELDYKIEPCGCSSNSNVTSLPACFETETYSCPGSHTTCGSTGCSTIDRENTCYRDVRMCCDGFVLNGDRCYDRWSTWSIWSKCSKTCDTGTKTRSRTCLRSPCRGSPKDTQSCNDQKCNVTSNGEWGKWGKWMTCSTTCGAGTRRRFRNCLKYPCRNGTVYEAESCKIKDCDDEWSPWFSWSGCSKTCDTGFRSRSRTCYKPPCSGVNSETKSCYEKSCQGQWNNWNSWTTCTKTCGTGSSSRWRTCSGNSCSGESYQTKSCNTKSCNGEWNSWSSWSSCSKTCGTGSSYRLRGCSKYPCRGDRFQIKSCNIKECSGQWNNWTPWTTCTKTCGTGSSTRRRTCSGNSCIGKTYQTKPCNTKSCSGEWNSWSSWSTCSKTCNTGTTIRWRLCKKYSCYGDSFQSKTCNAKSCSGEWNSWSNWSTCSKTCGTGITYRWRGCKRYPCLGSRTETSVCNTKPCPDQWGNWNPWSACSVSCGSGTKKRVRTCRVNPCRGSASQTQSCYPKTCPTSNWSPWSSWSQCSKTCALGFQMRTRKCPKTTCSGSPFEGRRCYGTKCTSSWSNWSNWGSCSKTCGTGTRSRTRTCSGSNCSGSRYSVKTCYNQSCTSTWSNWSSWGSCSKTCGTGTRSRTRTCFGSNCSGSPPSELQSCITMLC